MSTQLVRWEWDEGRRILSTWDDRDILVEDRDHLLGYVRNDGVFVLVDVVKARLGRGTVH